MLRHVRRSWHKARALAALQTYLELPLKEPLSAQHDAQLKRLSVRALAEGDTPIDTAFRFFAEYAAEWVESGRSLDELRFHGALGRMFALRDQLRAYREHHEMFIAIAKAEEAYRK